MWELQRKRRTLQRLEQSELMSLQQQYEWFLAAEQKIAALAGSLNERSTQIPELLTSHISVGIPDPPESERATALRNTISNIEQHVLQIQQPNSTATSTIQNRLASMLVATQEAATLFAASFAIFRDENTHRR